MNSIKTVIFVLLFISEGNAQSVMDSAQCRPRLSIKSDIKGALILLNGRVAATDQLDTSVQKGKYIITVEEKKDKWDPMIFSDTVNAFDCTGYNFNYKFKTKIYLRTDPQDVYVYLGDTLFGHTPLFIEKSDFRENTFKLRKPGYNDKYISAREALANPLIKLDYIGKTNGKSFFERDIFKFLVGSIVVLGGTTAYFKLKADNEFEDYQQTGNSQSLKNTRRYDLISGISFAALQLNFGFLIYYFLVD